MLKKQIYDTEYEWYERIDLPNFMLSSCDPDSYFSDGIAVHKLIRVRKAFSGDIILEWRTFRRYSSAWQITLAGGETLSSMKLGILKLDNLDTVEISSIPLKGVVNKCVVHNISGVTVAYPLIEL